MTYCLLCWRTHGGMQDWVTCCYTHAHNPGFTWFLMLFCHTVADWALFEFFHMCTWRCFASSGMTWNKVNMQWVLRVQWQPLLQLYTSYALLCPQGYVWSTWFWRLLVAAFWFTCKAVPMTTAQYTILLVLWERLLPWKTGLHSLSKALDAQAILFCTSFRTSPCAPTAVLTYLN